MATKSRKWIVTEHRQIVVEHTHDLCESDAARIAFSQSNPEYVASDHTKRYSYAVVSDESADR
jgi:hypothetical protein